MRWIVRRNIFRGDDAHRDRDDERIQPHRREGRRPRRHEEDRAGRDIGEKQRQHRRGLSVKGPGADAGGRRVSDCTAGRAVRGRGYQR